MKVELELLKTYGYNKKKVSSLTTTIASLTTPFSPASCSKIYHFGGFVIEFIDKAAYSSN